MENRDEKLWQLATQRANFKGKVLSYLAVNAFLWILWWITTYNNDTEHIERIPWPAWVTLGWGLGLLIKYVKIFHTNAGDSIQQEYDKLKNKQE